MINASHCALVVVVGVLAGTSTLGFADRTALRTMEPKYSVPEMEILFASAIKADPQGPYAKPSYVLLEEFGYVRDMPLARVEASSKLIDMGELRRLSEPRKAP